MVWQGLTSSLPPPETVRDVERIFWFLRKEGHELLHVIGRDTFSDGKRREATVLFLIPSCGEATGHRWLAEMLVHRYSGGRKDGKVENVAVRYSTDWEDWEVVHDIRYFEAQGSLSYRISIPTDGGTTGQRVLDKVWQIMSGMIGGNVEATDTQREFKKIAGRATAEINVSGETVCAFTVARRFRKSESRQGGVPCVMVALWEESKQAEETPVAGAVIIVDLVGKTGRTKPIAVRYEGEWPVTHQYRKKFPPPNLDDFKGLIREEKRQVV
jgi:hypothetical protein